MGTMVPSTLLQGVRRHLNAPHARILQVQRQPFTGGLSGSHFESWHLTLQQAGPVSHLTLIYKRGRVVTGAFLQGAGEREAQCYAHLAPHLPLRTPTVVAVDPTTAEIWMLPLPPHKPTSHWHAAWHEDDLRAAISDLARLHATFWEQRTRFQTWPWLAQPTQAHALGLLADARAGLERLIRARAWDESLTQTRLQQMWALAQAPERILAPLRDGPQTLLHGDAGFQNIAITQDGRCLWYDWQLVGWGPPALDWVTFLHPWAYPEATPPMPLEAMTREYLAALARWGHPLSPGDFQHQLNAALLWRWLIQWAPLLGLYHQRLSPQIRRRLYHAFAQLHWPALAE